MFRYHEIAKRRILGVENHLTLFVLLRLIVLASSGSFNRISLDSRAGSFNSVQTFLGTNLILLTTSTLQDFSGFSSQTSFVFLTGITTMIFSQISLLWSSHFSFITSFAACLQTSLHLFVGLFTGTFCNSVQLSIRRGRRS